MNAVVLGAELCFLQSIRTMEGCVSFLLLWEKLSPNKTYFFIVL
jgi:hypothetical protein